MKLALRIAIPLAITALVVVWYLRRSSDLPKSARPVASTAENSSPSETIQPPKSLARPDEPKDVATTLAKPDDTLSSPSPIRTRVLKVPLAEAKRRGYVARQARERKLAPQGKFDSFPVVQSPSGKWAMVPGLWAIHESAPLPAGEVIHRGLGHVFVKLAPNVSPPDTALPAVYNPRRGTFGILSGGVFATLKNTREASVVGRDYRLQLTQQYEDMNVAAYRTTLRDVEDLNRLITSMGSDNRISETKLEVFDRLLQPQ